MIVILVFLIFLAFYFLFKLKGFISDKPFVILIFTSVFLWNLMPTILTLLFWNNNFSFRIVSFNEFVNAASIETAYLDASLLIFLYFARKKRIKSSLNKLFLFSNNSPKFELKIIRYSIFVVIFYDIVVYVFFKNQYYSSLSGQSVLITLFLPIVTFSEAILYVYIIYKRKEKRLSFIIILIILFDIWMTLTRGSRMSMILLLLIPLLVYQNTEKKFSFRKKFLIILVFLTSFFVILKVIPTSEVLRSKGNSIKLNQISSAINSANSYLMFNLFMRSLLVKLGSIQNTALLVKYQGYNNRGVEEFLSPFKILIPRFLWPNKYSSIGERPSRIAASYQGMNPDIGVVGISPALGVMWSNGLLGIMVSLVASFVFIKVLFVLSRIDNFFAKSFMLVMLNFPILDRVPNVYSFITISFILLSIVYIIYYMIFYFKFKY